MTDTSVETATKITNNLKNEDIVLMTPLKDYQLSKDREGREIRRLIKYDEVVLIHYALVISNEPCYSKLTTYNEFFPYYEMHINKVVAIHCGTF